MDSRERNGVQIRGKDLVRLIENKGYNVYSAAKEIGLSNATVKGAITRGRMSIGTIEMIRKTLGIRPTGYVRGSGSFNVDGQKLYNAVKAVEVPSRASIAIGASENYMKNVRDGNVISNVYAELLRARYGINAEEYAVTPPNDQQITFDDVEDEDTQVEETQDEPAEKKSQADGLAQAIAAGVERGIAKATEIMANTIALNYDMIHCALRDGIDYDKLALSLMYAFDLALERNKCNAHAAGNPLIKAVAEDAKAREAADT